MTNEEKQRANIAAARLLGIEYYLSDNVQSLELDSVAVKRCDDDTIFNIFTNTYDCLNAETELGTKYLCTVSFNHDKLLWQVSNPNDWGYLDNLFEIYQEAIATAVLEVMKDD